jgi:tetratricopeptide (TPR) repeat protein
MGDDATQPATGDRWVAVALVAAALIAYLSTLTFDFVYDDRWIVHGNPAIRGWASLVTVWSKPYWVTEGSASAGLYRPLLMAVFAVLWNAGLRFPLWYHLLAVVAHVAAIMLTWRLLRRAVGVRIAAAGALWFAVQPVHIEAVANIANSSEVLVTVAVLGLALVSLRAEAGTPAADDVSWKTSLGIGALYAAALLIKESGVTAPALAFVAVWGWRAAGERATTAHARAMWRRWRRPVIVCAGVFAATVVARIAVLGSVVSEGTIAAPGFHGVSAGQRVWAMLALGPRIVELLLWPRTLNPYYGRRSIEGHFGPSVPALLFLAASALIAVLAWRRATRGDRRPAAAVAWIAISFFPASNLLVATGQVLAERTLYLPSVGAVMLLAVVVEAIAARFTSSPRVVRSRFVSIGTAAACVLVFVAARATSSRSHAWANHEALFNQLIAADPGDDTRYRVLATYEQKRGRTTEAIALLQRAYEINPRDRALITDYATVLFNAGQSRRAAQMAGHLMEWPESRREPAAVTLYLESLGRAYGADSVLAAGERLFADAPLPATALFIGSAREVRGDTAGAAAAYRAGIANAASDTAGLRQLGERLSALRPHR